MVYIFDGTYPGLLTTVFTAFERKEIDVTIKSDKFYIHNLFEDSREIVTDKTKASRVQNGLLKLLPTNKVLDFWRAFLSEQEAVNQIIFKLTLLVFQGAKHRLLNFGDEDVLQFNQVLKKVSRERHRMKAFIRFSKSSDQLYVSVVEPDFNVLPLVITFFKNRYADQPWLIYDNKRQYGIYYNLHQVTEVTLSADNDALQKAGETIAMDSQDKRYEKMWQSYFQSTNIEARKNLKLHLRHVPKRYWKYLPEKINNRNIS